MIIRHRLSAVFIAFLVLLSLNSNAAAGNYLRYKEMEKFFSSAYSYIVSRYVDYITFNELVFNGIAGLKSIDYEVDYYINNNYVVLTYAGIEKAKIALPNNNNPDEWSEVVTEFINKLNEISPRAQSYYEKDYYETVMYYSMKDMDEYTRYVGENAAKEARSSRHGFGGIGIRFRKAADFIEITEVMPFSPAADNDLRVGDRIYEIDSTPLKGLKSEDVSDLLRGFIGSEVKLNIERNEPTDLLSIKVVRGLIIPPSVSYELYEGVLHLHVYSFNQKTSEAIEHIIKNNGIDNIKGIILDLRGNPGGLLEQAVAVADVFLDDGVIVSTKGKHPASFQKYNASYGDIARGKPIIVIIDGVAASSSEIVAAALADNGRAITVGTVSYGKGSVQTVTRLPNDGELAVTWSRFYSPLGYPLEGLGVPPIFCTSDEDKDANSIIYSTVNQGGRRIELLNEWKNAALYNSDELDSLRKKCAPSNKVESKLEAEVAKRLLIDDNLYRMALGFNSVLSARR